MHPFMTNIERSGRGDYKETLAQGIVEESHADVADFLTTSFQEFSWRGVGYW